MTRPGLPVKLYYRIGEVADVVGVEPHVLRYWESEFGTIRPQKSPKGQRVYSRKDLEKLLRVKELLYSEGYTIAGAKKKLREPNETAPLVLPTSAELRGRVPREGAERPPEARAQSSQSSQTAPSASSSLTTSPLGASSSPRALVPDVAEVFRGAEGPLEASRSPGPPRPETARGVEPRRAFEAEWVSAPVGEPELEKVMTVSRTPGPAEAFGDRVDRSPPLSPTIPGAAAASAEIADALEWGARRAPYSPRDVVRRGGDAEVGALTFSLEDGEELMAPAEIPPLFGDERPLRDGLARDGLVRPGGLSVSRGPGEEKLGAEASSRVSRSRATPEAFALRSLRSELLSLRSLIHAELSLLEPVGR